MNSNIARDAMKKVKSASCACAVGALLVAAPIAAYAHDTSAAGTQETLLDEGQRLFFSARYDAAAELMSAPCEEGLAAACEVRASALLFRMRRELGDAAGKKKAFEGCAPCGGLLTAFQRTTAHGRRLVKTELAARPEEEEVLFLVSKLA